MELWAPPVIQIKREGESSPALLYRLRRPRPSRGAGGGGPGRARGGAGRWRTQGRAVSRRSRPGRGKAAAGLGGAALRESERPRGARRRCARPSQGGPRRRSAGGGARRGGERLRGGLGDLGEAHLAAGSNGGRPGRGARREGRSSTELQWRPRSAASIPAGGGLNRARDGAKKV